MIPRLIAALVLGLVVLAFVTSCGTIETGHVGVRTTHGKVDAVEVGPDLYLGLPGISRAQEFSAKEIGLAMLKFAEKGGATTVVIPAGMQTAPLINIGGK